MGMRASRNRVRRASTGSVLQPGSTVPCPRRHRRCKTVAFSSTELAVVAASTVQWRRSLVTLAELGGAAEGSPNDPAVFPLDSSWSVGGYPAQGTGSGTAGFESFVSTAGFHGLSVSFDFRNQPS